MRITVSTSHGLNPLTGDPMGYFLRQLRESQEGIVKGCAEHDEEDQAGGDRRLKDGLDEGAQVSPPLTSAMIPVPAAPTAAPSVGVNQPA